MTREKERQKHGLGLPARPANGLSLCGGGGGLDLGLHLAEPGFRTLCWVEIEDYPRQAIIAAQRAGYFAPAPIWDDVTTFDGRPFRGAFDTILAGYPCQPFSQAGQRRGADDERHLWPEVARIIREVEPEWVFLENVAGHVSLGLETVLRELWGMDYAPAAGLFTAAEVGAPHERKRVFIVAHPERRAAERQRSELAEAPGDLQGEARKQRLWADARDGSDRVADPGGGRCAGSDEGQDQQPRGAEAIGSGGAMADASGAERQRQQPGQRDARGRQEPHGHPALPGGTGIFPPGPGDAAAWAETLATAPYLAPATSLGDCLAWARDVAAALEGQDQAQAESSLRGMAHGLASRSRALRLLGNGVVPICAAHAWRSLAAAHGLLPVHLGAASGDGEGATDDLTVRAAE